MMETAFYSPTHGKIPMRHVLEDICTTIGASNGGAYKIIIGADSHAKRTAVITTVVIIQRTGAGSRYFYTQSSPQRYATLRDRIFAEAMSSITLAQELRAFAKDQLNEDALRGHHEIHVDIGTNGPTRELVDAVTGMLKGYDFVPVIKPESFAAFAVADRHTR